jgi:hypothetical protein
MIYAKTLGIILRIIAANMEVYSIENWFVKNFIPNCTVRTRGDAVRSMAYTYSFQQVINWRIPAVIIPDLDKGRIT